TIQRASERALHHGVRLRDCLSMVKDFRGGDTQTPVVLMGYANPIEAMGHETFCARCKDSGVDGVLTVDYPPEEGESFAPMLGAHGIDPIYLLSPTTVEARLRQLVRLARGFVYYVSLKGVTGASHIDLDEVARSIERIRAHSALPVGVGFGIRDRETARQVAGFADAVVIGSRIVEEIETSAPDQVLDRATRFVHDIRLALDGA
ncbi:MAG: tryptophan synthase subunit alpha, partial [Burkholderiales bacterium]